MNATEENAADFHHSANTHVGRMLMGPIATPSPTPLATPNPTPIATGSSSCPPNPGLANMTFDEVTHLLSQPSSALQRKFTLLQDSRSGCASVKLNSKCTAGGIPNWGDAAKVRNTWSWQYSPATFEQYGLLCNTCNSAKAPFIPTPSACKDPANQNTWNRFTTKYGAVVADLGWTFNCQYEMPSICTVQLCFKESEPAIANSWHDSFTTSAASDIQLVVQCGSIQKQLICVPSTDQDIAISTSKSCFVTKRAAGVMKIGVRAFYKGYKECQSWDDTCRWRVCADGKCQTCMPGHCPPQGKIHPGAWEEEDIQVKELLSTIRKNPQDLQRLEAYANAQCANEIMIF